MTYKDISTPYFTFNKRMETIIDGSEKLLSEVSKIIPGGVDFIIVGGWGPFLRNKDKHPGTLDVDILFQRETPKSKLKEIANLFLEKEYFPSAKHSFQLLRKYEIQKNSYIFNVDFLHPSLEKSDVLEFNDIIDFDISIDGKRVKTLTSIVMPHGDILFNNEMYQLINIEGIEIKILSSAGTFFSKLKSCTNPKRPRDIYDMLLSVQEDQFLWKTIQKYSDMNGDIKNMVSSFKETIENRWSFFEECLKKFKITVTDEVKKNILGL